MTSRILFRLPIAALVSVAWLLAQDPDFTIKVDVPLVSVDVTVQDANGKIINGLPVNAFEVFENGVRQEIRNFSPNSTPYNILLLFDRSGSTQDKWPLMQRAVAGFIANLRIQDRIALATFDEELQRQLAWTSDRRKALLTLPDLIAGEHRRGTNFYDSVDRALRREFQKVTNRKALVVLTDGRDTSFYLVLAQTYRLLDTVEDRPYQKVLKTARSQRIPIYFVAFNTDKNLEPNIIGGDEYKNLQVLYPRSPIPQQYLESVRLRMEQLADASGGRVFYPERLEDIVPLYGQIGRELGTSYSLGYISSAGKPDNGSYRKIEVRVRGEKLRITQSRDGYYLR